MKILTPKLNSFGAPLLLRADLVPPKDPPTKPPEPKKALADPAP
jgi:hypothetical protein